MNPESTVWTQQKGCHYHSVGENEDSFAPERYRQKREKGAKEERWEEAIQRRRGE